MIFRLRFQSPPSRPKTDVLPRPPPCDTPRTSAMKIRHSETGWHVPSIGPASAHSCRSSLSAPAPVDHFRHVFAVGSDVLLVLLPFALEQFDRLIGLEPRHAVDGINRQLESVHVVAHH